MDGDLAIERVNLLELLGLFNGMLLSLKLLLFAIVTGLAAYSDDWLKNRSREKHKGKIRNRTKAKEKPRSPKSKLLFWILSALVLVVSNEVIDRLGIYFERPSIDIHTTNSGKSIRINLKVINGTVDRIALKYPIFGVIGKFEDQNDVTSARPAVAEATGFANESNSFLNYIQMFMTDIQSGQNLNYLVYYTPTQWPAFMMGTDRYQLSYIWEFQGQRIEEVEWRWVKDDRIAPMPAGIVEAAQITPHSLTPDQINQELQEELQEGISKRPLQ